MSKNRNPYAMAHSLRGGAGAGAHKDRRQDIIDDLTDPYSQEWMELCDRAPTPACDDTGVKDLPPNRPKPLSRQFLLDRGYCCGSGCTNCPYTTEESP